jgi:glutamyl-tRNA(Gln) amidotransferase subunit E
VKQKGFEMYAVALPGFDGLLSHFTQPGKTFADEISDRLKVIACIEKPNLTSSEALKSVEGQEFFAFARKLTGAKINDPVVIFWGLPEDMPTAIETIDERCRMALEGVPNETRKGLEDGTTIFERVLPGADRMYPDTDSPPIPLDEIHIQNLAKDLPVETMAAYRQMQKWNIPEDTYTFILKNNLYQILKKLIENQKLNPVFAGTLLGHRLRYEEGQQQVAKSFRYEQLIDLVKECQARQLHLEILKPILPLLLSHPNMDFDSLLVSVNFKKIKPEDILSGIKFLKNKYKSIGRKLDADSCANWIMGQLRPKAIGNMNLAALKKAVEENSKQALN